MTILGNWTNKGPTMSRPKFSDVTGKVLFLKEDFNPPPGWRWDSEWYISPELRYVPHGGGGSKIWWNGGH